MKTQTYTRRDSATARLRKIGIQARDYNFFITKEEGSSSSPVWFVCHYEKAEKHLADLKKKPAKKASVKKSTKRTVTSAVREMLFGGKSNAEIWTAIKAEFNLDDKKKSYPAWYRADAKRRGLIEA